jgi:U3 small nucleolar RNA-associated protein 19
MPTTLRSLPPPTKKRKISDESDLIESIRVTEEELTTALANNTSINALADLVNVATHTEGAEATSKAIYALYRIFVLVINDEKLRPQVDESSKAIRSWIWERLNTYVGFLGGLLQDEEKMLRMSALQILFSLLKHLSSSATSPGAHNEPQLHVNYFRKLIGFLLLCPPSTRSASSSNTSRSLQADVRDTFVDTILSVHDDIRWFFLRDAGTILEADSANNSLAPANMLSILEKLPIFPTAASQLKTWWIPGFQAKPAKLDSKGREEEEESPSDDDEEDDWRKFFDEPVKKNAPAKTSSIRLHKMTIHQSLYSLNSHRAVYTKAWLGLLPLLSKDSSTSKSLSVRVLNIMHRGILPHLTRPILVMDWVASCVDFGGTAGLLALNALFILMKDYNLY